MNDPFVLTACIDNYSDPAWPHQVSSSLYMGNGWFCCVLNATDVCLVGVFGFDVFVMQLMSVSSGRLRHRAQRSHRQCLV